MSKKKRKNRKKEPSYSSLERHKRQGKSLVPPLLQIDQLQLQSWANNRLPELLWAALLIAHLPRELALSVFRDVASYAEKFVGSKDYIDVTLSGIAQLDSASVDDIIDILTSEPTQGRILRPLALINDLPAFERWRDALEVPNEEDWELLKIAVAQILDHQSQNATDCRWARVTFMMHAGKLVLPTEELAKEVFYYPNYGEMPKVRPFIRSTEGAVAQVPPPTLDFASKFWSQCMKETSCEAAHSPTNRELIVTGTTLQCVNDVYISLVEHCNQTRVTIDIDARHDSVFRIALYALSILQELLRIGAAQSISARMLLRTLLECLVTLTYLVQRDSPDLWQSYRSFGTGQAKLAFIKLDQSEEQVGYVKKETLEQLANEDMWHEFVSVNIGHWEKTNLRTMSENAGVKPEYDRYYGWTSSFSHGHWGAVRDTVFEICQNPLHRLHRIPRSSPRTQEDVLSDACQLVDKILVEISKIYPGFDRRVSISS